MDPIAIFICAVVGALTCLYLFVRQRFLYWEKRNVPFIKPTFPQGNLKGVGSAKHLIDVMDEIYHKFKGKVLFAGAFFGLSPVAIITDLDLIKHILIKDFNYFRDRAMYVNEKDDPLTGNLFFMQSEKWRRLRQKLSPIFASGKIKFMYPTILDVSESMVSHLHKRIVQEEPFVEIKDVLARYTTDIIGRVAFGIECNSLHDPEAVFRKYGQKVFAEPHRSNVALEFMGQCPKLAKMLKMKVFSPEVFAFFLNTVRETIDYREKNDIRRSDFLDLLIQMKNETRPDAPKLSFMEIVAQCFGFFLAAFETSSTTMSFSLFELALNVELQDKARQDVLSTLEKYNGELSYEAIMNMDYIGQMISESLRKYPSLSLNRKTIKDYQVPGTDKILKKNIGIVIPVYSIHHDPEIYTNPDEYRPERFSPEEQAGRHPMAFLGFGDGPRNCLGMQFGTIQSKLGLAILLKNFRFKLAPTVSVPLTFDKNAFILTSASGIDLIIEKI